MKFTLLTPLVFLFLCLVPAQAQQDMPYIYYFDSVAGGMVVERADGSDSRVFEGVYAPVMWSPSGEWFVYRHNGALVRFSTDGIGNPFVVYEPNTTSNTVSHREIQFAPSNDLLAIMEYSINYDNYLGEAYLLVVDILSGEIVAEANAGYIDSYYTY